eukprot:jgi/Phyca11/110838/e_gw1.19.405.1
MNSVATSCAETVFVVAIKWERLVSRSTTPQIEFFPVFVSGKSVMKSIEIERHRSSGICRGSKRAGVFVNRGLFRLQSSQSAMYFVIIRTILGQYQSARSFRYVRSTPECPP